MLVTSVIYVKRGEDKNFVIVDAAMNDLIRPTLYDAHHEILAARRAARSTRRGCAPTSSARCAKAATISPSTAKSPSPSAGDLLAVMSAGAYGAVQAGTYNSRLLVPEVLVKGDRIRGRPAAAELRGIDRPRQNSAVVAA